MILKELIELFMKYKEKRIKSSSFYNYKNLIKMFFKVYDEKTDLKDLTNIKLQFGLDNFGENHKKSSSAILLNLIKSIVSFAVRFNFLPENQINLKYLEILPKRKTIEDIKKEKENKEIIYSLDDLDHIFSKIKKVDEDEKFIFYFGLNTGMRIGEILGLTWDDINLNNNTIEITKNFLKNIKKIDTPKTLSSVRTIYISDDVKKELIKIKTNQMKNKFKMGKKYIREYLNNKELDYVFRRKNGEKITYNFLLNTIKKIKKIDKNFHFHLLRHSFCSQYLQNGVDVIHVAKILGHSSVNTTLRIYSHIKKDDIINVMKKVNIQ